MSLRMKRAFVSYINLSIDMNIECVEKRENENKRKKKETETLSFNL